MSPLHTDSFNLHYNLGDGTSIILITYIIDWWHIKTQGSNLACYLKNKFYIL